MTLPAHGRRQALLLGLALAWLPARAATRDIDQALRDAAAAGDLPAFQALLVRGADVNARDARLDTALFVAARHGHAALVQAAVAAGADLKLLNRFGSTALMGPAYRGHVEVVRVLLGTPIDLQHVNDLGWTALLETIALGQNGPRHRQVVQLLIAAGSDLQARDRDGVSALELALRRGQDEVVRLLRAAGAR
jgi:ankyrin repeat protein